MKSKFKEFKKILFESLQNGELTIEEVNELAECCQWAVYGNKLQTIMMNELVKLNPIEKH